MREREIALKPGYKCGLKGKRGQSHRPLVATSVSPTPQPLPPNTSHTSCVIIILMKRTHGQMACSCFCQYSRHINLKFALFEADSLWIRRGINDQSLISMINTCRSGSKTSFSCYVSVRGQLIARKWRWKWTSHSLSYSRFRRLSSSSRFFQHSISHVNKSRCRACARACMFYNYRIRVLASTCVNNGLHAT